MDKANEVQERREVLFSGRVQGVGFRFTTRQIAGRFAVAGYVQNLDDGRVLLMAEGSRAALDGFVAAVQAELDRFIRQIQISRRPPNGEFTIFEVRY